MIATANAKSIEEIKSFLSRQKEEMCIRDSLTGFQYFDCPVCHRFGMFFQYHSPHSGQRAVQDVYKRQMSFFPIRSLTG